MRFTTRNIGCISTSYSSLVAQTNRKVCYTCGKAEGPRKETRIEAMDYPWWDDSERVCAASNP